MTSVTKAVLKRFEDLQPLLAIAEKRNIVIEGDTSKKIIIGYLVKDINKTGFKKFLESLTRDDLLRIVEEVHITLPERKEPKKKAADDDKPPPKPQKVILQSRTMKYVFGGDDDDQEENLDGDLQEFFSKMSKELLYSLCAKLDDLQPINKYGKEELYQRGIIPNIETIGLENCLYNFTIQELKGFCESTGVDVDEKVRRKDSIIQGLIDHTDVTYTKKKKKKPQKRSDKKPSKITAKTKKVDLEQWFNLTELREFCKEHGLLVSGKKKVVVERIIKWHAGDTESTMPGNKKRGRKKRSRSRSPNPESKKARSDE
jgi:hypothetical protein